MDISQENRIASVTTPLGKDKLVLYRMTGSEHLSRLYNYDVELLSEKNNIDFKQLLGQEILVELNENDRYFHGIITHIKQVGMIGDLYCYQAIINPKMWLLTRASNCRIMPTDTTVPDIVKNILSKHNITDIELKLTANYQPRAYCVQYRETDFNFISRLMEEEGIYYYFKHAKNTHTLVLCDAPFAHDKMSEQNGQITYFEGNNAQRDPHFYVWDVSQTIQADSYHLNDYDFEVPALDLNSKSVFSTPHVKSNAQMYDYPGQYKKLSEGEQYTKVRMQELQAQYETISAMGNIRSLSTGHKFNLIDFPREDQNREYLVIAASFIIQNNDYQSSNTVIGRTFDSSYTLMSTEYNYRPPRVTPIPIVQGVQTAVVVGKQGDEITTDKYGRIKIQFHWDREGKNDENSSCWVRVAQVWAGKNWGAMHIPRIGQEVIVDFLEGNPDRPIITGCVYNADQMPPYELDANKTQSGIKSRSTKNGSAENFNEIRFEDKKGEEELYVHAEKNFTRVVENNDTHKVGFDKKSPGDQKIDIYNDRTVSLEQGNESLTVKMGNRSTEIKQGNDELKIAMGNRVVKVDLGKISEEAMQSIELTVGQSSIKIDQTGITIKGMMIKIEGQLQTEIKGTMTTVSGDAMLTHKGGIIMIN